MSNLKSLLDAKKSSEEFDTEIAELEYWYHQIMQEVYDKILSDVPIETYHIIDTEFPTMVTTLIQQLTEDGLNTTSEYDGNLTYELRIDD